MATTFDTHAVFTVGRASNGGGHPTLTVAYRLENLANNAQIGGLHIHSGTSCSSAGGHYWDSAAVTQGNGALRPLYTSSNLVLTRVLFFRGTFCQIHGPRPGARRTVRAWRKGRLTSVRGILWWTWWAGRWCCTTGKGARSPCWVGVVYFGVSNHTEARVALEDVN